MKRIVAKCAGSQWSNYVRYEFTIVMESEERNPKSHNTGIMDWKVKNVEFEISIKTDIIIILIDTEVQKLLFLKTYFYIMPKLCKSTFPLNRKDRKKILEVGIFYWLGAITWKLILCLRLIMSDPFSQIVSYIT